MNRREFLRQAALVGAGAYAAGALGGHEILAAAAQPDLIVAEGGRPEALLQAALKSYGGLGQIVKPGKTVVIKANFSWNRPPEQAATTNPDLLVALVRACLAAGARKVRVVDLAIEPAEMCLNTSGIKRAVQAAGGEVQDLNLEQPRVPRLTIVNSGVLKKLPVYVEALEADCLINVPILKHHRVTSMTGALKNLMGFTPLRADMHAAGIDQAIVDLAGLIKPHLHLIDAYRVMTTFGPQGPGTVETPKQLILTRDPLAGDVYGADLLKLDPFYLKLAAKAGLGRSDLKDLRILRVKA